MIKLIQRKTDKKYFQSLENDVWVDSRNEAFQMTYRECELIKETLKVQYAEEQIKEIIDFTKSKFMSEEEIKELKGLFKNK